MNKITIPVTKAFELPKENLEQKNTSSYELEKQKLHNVVSEKDAQIESLTMEVSLLKDTIQQMKAEIEENEGIEELVPFLLQEIRDNVDTAFDGFTTEMADILSVSLAKILGQLLVDKDTALSVIRNVIDQENILDILQVRVSTRDFDMVNGYAKFEDLKALQFVPDPSVETGGCILQLRSGLVDGRVDVQLKSLNDLMRMAIS